MRRSERLLLKSAKPKSTTMERMMEEITTGEAITTTETTNVTSATITGNANNSNQNESSKSVASARSCRSGNSVASQRRLLEAQAIRQKAEIEFEVEQKKAEMIMMEAKKNLVDARLEEELAALENSDVYSVKSARTRVWVETVVNSEVCMNETEKTDIPNQKCSNPIGLINTKDDTSTEFQSSLNKLTRTLTDTLKACTSAPSNTADKLLGRLSSRDLPPFSGDPLDWLRFKNAFHTTTRIGQYTEGENIARLQRCLHGEAWEAVSARLLATTSATDVMATLEMRFGRPDLIIGKLVAEMRKVPKLTGARSELIILATKVDNCVAAIESTGNLGYLYSPELTTEIINKLTEPIFYRWLDYSRGLTRQSPQLPALAGYLINEAQEICRRGAVEPPSHKSTAPLRRSVLMTDLEGNIPDDTTQTNHMRADQQPSKCVFCDHTGHQINACETFIQKTTDERWEWICKRRLCFRCLKATHRRDRCKSKIKCTTCKGNHHKLLHRHDWVKTEMDEKKSPETTANIWFDGKKVFLKVLPVTIEGPEGSTDTYALLDEGSTITLVEDRIAKLVAARGPVVELALQGAVGKGSHMKSQIVSLDIKTSNGSYQLNRVRTVNDLTLPKHCLAKDVISQYDHLKNVPLEAFVGRPSILIGQDNWHLIVSREIKEGKADEPVASLTKLGWVIHGFSSSISKKIIPELTCHIRSEEDNELHILMENYFQLDNLGVRNSEQPRYSLDERRALHILDTKSKKRDNYWESALLWREDNALLPDNKRNPEHRLHIIEKMMDSDSSFATDYTKQVDNMLEKNYAKKAESSPTGRIWYLPHFGVRNPNKPGKLRLVFDAKAETKGVSLNSELLSGPDLLNSLIGVLLRFRERTVAVTADIKEMFLQIKINEDDQNAQCFLWRGMERHKPPDTYKMVSMTFGATSSPCTATYIIRRNADDFTSSHPRAVEAIKRRHYVDDYLDSLDSEEEMKQLVSDVIMVHKAGGFDIRGWSSNRPHILPVQDKSQTVSLLQQSDEIQRTLGLNWKPNKDTLGFDLSFKKVDGAIIEGRKRPTKREMLKVVMSVFDPLGMLCPFLINAKILLQDVWRSGTKWDEPISEKLFPHWLNWIDKLKTCKALSIPRCYSFSVMKELNLHIFVDASEQAYAAVAYLTRAEKVVFIAGKSRVAPLKSATVPKLELQAALMGARLGHTICAEQALDIEKRHFWTDSQTVWRWINNKPRRHNIFVSNRLAEIDDITLANEWKWLPGKLNVADEATRENQNFMFTNSKWISGPEFLQLPEEMWPNLQPQTEAERNDQECVLAVEGTNSLIDFSRYSKWRRLRRSVAYMYLYLDKCRGTVSSLTVIHLDKAEKFIFRQIQAESFAEELVAIGLNKPLQPQSRLRGLNPYINEDGLLYARSRLASATDLPSGLKTPVILDAKHPVVKLIIEHKHEQLGHQGTATLINELRQDYYVFRLRNVVRSLLATCITCKRRKARCEQPMMAALPEIRLHHHCRPFSYCGIDLFGPITVTIGRRHEKRWGVLFTCLSVRAVHMEIAASLSTDSTIMAIRRMAARRGWPKQIHSDNGTNFRSADKELRQAVKDVLSDRQLIDKATELGILWTFNPPEAPHMGGVWERLVRSIKTALAATLNTRTPKEEVLATLLTEAEITVNSRPLTHVSLDLNEEEALTPNHFLIGSSSGSSSPGKFTDDDLTLRKQWKISQRLSDHFWSRWLKEYLPSLQERSKWVSDRGVNVVVGDLVLIADSSSPRNIWPRGRVTNVIPGRDGRIRMADVQTRGGILRRPTNKLVVLARVKESASTTS